MLYVIIEYSLILKTIVLLLHCMFVCVAVPGPVTSLAVTERGSFHVKLEWEEPINKNGIITNYLIEYVVG